jgi:predicted lipid-binding transport protein (Tim44 family)
MKKWLSLLAVVMTLGLGTVHLEAEAKRMGGGKSTGMQRQVAPPASTPNTPTAAPAAAGAAGGAAASTGRSWMGPVAGLAAGLGIAALASHLGFGEELANMLMMGLLVVAVIAVIGFVMRKRAATQQGGGLAYAGASAGMNRASQPAGQAFRTPTAPNGGSMIGSALGSQTVSSRRIPADFDVAAFERNAKVNFIRLQAANDAGNLDDLRAFTTPEMFAELSMDLSERGTATQHTDVVRIDTQVIDVEEGADRYVVSVRFTGETRENDAPQTESFDETWHLTKPRHGAGGWVLAGIEQNA